jgi:putative membrane protein
MPGQLRSQALIPRRIFCRALAYFPLQAFTVRAEKSRNDKRLQKNKQGQAQAMKVFWGLGKLLTIMFWLVVLINLAVVLPSPFALLIKLAGSLLALTHVVELLLFNGSLRGRPRPWRDRLQILLFGMFHLQSFPKNAPEAAHA